jgi:uncharacterized protein (TIGR03067 family)
MRCAEGGRVKLALSVVEQLPMARIVRPSSNSVEVVMSCYKLVFAVSLLSFQIDSPVNDAAKKDLQHFQGNWRAAAVINADGRPATTEELERTRLIVDGNKFTLKGKDFVIKGQFTIDPSKSPKAIDAVLDSKEGEKPVKVLGIYRIDGETRKSCFAMPDKPRPTKFPASPEGYLQLEWKR